MKRDKRKIHKYDDDRMMKGDYTLCGRRITEDTRLSQDIEDGETGIEAVTCRACANMYDFGILCR